MSLSSTKTPVKPSKTESSTAASNKPVSSEKEDCPEIKYLLADFVEIVTQDEEKWVKGAAKDLTDTSVIKESVERKDKDGDKFKQYINFDDAKEPAKTHPEYGQKITFKARVKRGDGKKEDLSGVKVVFKCKWEKAANRASADDKIWNDAELTGNQKGGFGSGRETETTADTDDKGWTPAVSFYTTRYGGDQFKITAELGPLVKAASRRPPMPTKSYVVWRKFWYQMTYADGFAAVQPTGAEKAYKEVFAEMVLASKKEFKEIDLPDDLKKRTFLKEYQLKLNGRDKIVANVGTGNIKEFQTHEKDGKTEPRNEKLGLDIDAKQPVKENIIICEFQCDPIGQTGLFDAKLTRNGQEITLPAIDLNRPIISNPALKANTNLVVRGKWKKKNETWDQGGDIVDDCIIINKDRDSLLKVTVDLSRGGTNSPPVPTDIDHVDIRLKLEAAKGYSGWAASNGGIVAVYDPSAAAGASKSKEDFSDTAAHEFGHKFTQTPEPAAKPPSLKAHPLQHHHGKNGSHCRHGVTKYEMCGIEWNGEASLEFETKIEENKDNSRIHKVNDASKFINIIGRKVLVNGVERTLKAVDTAHKKLQFTHRFNAQRNWKVEHKIDWQEKKEDPYPLKGDCIMYLGYCSRCSHKFCDTCKPYLQLQDMSSLT